MVVKPGLEEQIIELEKWLKTQPQLPQNIGILNEKYIQNKYSYTQIKC